MNDNLSAETKQLVTDLFKATTAIVEQASKLAAAGEPAREAAHHLWEAAAPAREHLKILEDTVRHLHGVPTEIASDQEGIELIGMIGAWADENEREIRSQIERDGCLHMTREEAEHFVKGFTGVQDTMRSLLNDFSVKMTYDPDAS